MATGEMNMPCSPFPLYPEMIYAALDALNEKMGSNKTSISRFIESKYKHLPPSHSILLRHHLNKMKENGDLIFWKNNYMKPDPNFIRRGRGRPPKSSSGTASNEKTPTPSSATPAAACPVFGGAAVKPRGRPRKDAYDAVTTGPDANDIDVDGEKEKIRRGRGRPPKLPRVDDAGGGAVGTGTAVRPRGRPPKVKPTQTASGAGYDLGSSE